MTPSEPIPVRILKPDPNPRYNASVARYRKTPDGKFRVVGMTLAEVDEAGHILRCSAMTCVWAGQERFDGWLKGQVEPDTLIVLHDGGKAYREYAAWRETEEAA